MYLNLDEIIKEANGLPLVPSTGTTVYYEKTPLLKKFVDDSLASNPAIHELIGNNPLQVMYDNHTNHAALMATVFSIGNYELLVRTVLWVYRAYSAHNFSNNYFPLGLQTWIEALEKYTHSEMTAEIKTVYAWLIDRHENMIYLSQTETELQPPISKDWLERKNSFLAAVLGGDHRKCLDIAKGAVPTGKDIEQFYLQIIQPVMYEIGMLWERGSISVAEEHLASAIVGRVMASTSMLEVISSKSKGKAVITSAPNEFHEIGAWMISDILEQDGWDVRYLGANIPANDLFGLLRSFKPMVLALSVTMPFNILKAKGIINALKADKELKEIQVILGGQPFNGNNELWRSTGADHFAANAAEIKTLLQNLEK